MTLRIVKSIHSFALLPCPFCGGEATHSVGERDGQPWYYVECVKCAAGSEPQMWNKRAFSDGEELHK